MEVLGISTVDVIRTNEKQVRSNLDLHMDTYANVCQFVRWHVFHLCASEQNHTNIFLIEKKKLYDEYDMIYQKPIF